MEHGVAGVAGFIQFVHRGRSCAGFVAGMGLGGEFHGGGPHVGGEFRPFRALVGVLRIRHVSLAFSAIRAIVAALAADLAGPLLESAETRFQSGIDCWALHPSSVP